MTATLVAKTSCGSSSLRTWCLWRRAWTQVTSVLNMTRLMMTSPRRDRPAALPGRGPQSRDGRRAGRDVPQPAGQQAGPHCRPASQTCRPAHWRSSRATAAGELTHCE